MVFSFLYQLFLSWRVDATEKWMAEATPETILEELDKEIQVSRMRSEMQDLAPFQTTFGALSSDREITSEQITAAISTAFPGLDQHWIKSVPVLMRVIQLHASYPFIGLPVRLTPSVLLRGVYNMANRSKGLYGAFGTFGAEHKIFLFPRLKKDRLQMWFWALAGNNPTDGQTMASSLNIHEIRQWEIVKLLGAFQDDHISPSRQCFAPRTLKQLEPFAARLSEQLPCPTISHQISQDMCRQWAELIQAFPSTEAQSGQPADENPMDFEEFEAFADRTQMFQVISNIIDKAFFQTSREGIEHYGQPYDMDQDDWEEMGYPAKMDVS